MWKKLTLQLYRERNRKRNKRSTEGFLPRGQGLSRWLSGKESTCECRRCHADLIPGLERSPGGENGNPLQYSCLENPRDRGAWRAAVHGITESQTRLSDSYIHTYPWTTGRVSAPKVLASVWCNCRGCRFHGCC